MKTLPHIYRVGSSLTFVHKQKSYTINKNDAFFDQAVAAFKAGQWDKLVAFVDRPQFISRFSAGRIQVADDAVLFDGTEVRGYIVDKILEFLREGLPLAPIVAFLDDLMNSPFEHVKEDLYRFLENNDLPMTEDGGFLAYKLTKADGTPYYQGGDMVYKVGELAELPIEECDKGRDECSGASLYFGRKDYWGSQMFNGDEFVGDGKMFLVKIMPSWVVSVPAGEGGRKGKAYKMLPIMEYSKAAKAQTEHVKVADSYEDHSGQSWDDIYGHENEPWVDEPIETEPKVYKTVNRGQFKPGNRQYLKMKRVKGRFVAQGQAKRDSHGRFTGGVTGRKLAAPKRAKNGRFV